MFSTKSIDKKPFNIKDKIGYLFGDLGNDFTFILSSSFLLKFYTDVMRVPPWIVGLIMTIARFLDAFTDVTMGRICDKGRIGEHGKFKPWIRRMAAPVAISSFLIYQSSFADRELWFKVLWLSITYILWGSIFYTSINIPYGSMASSISENPEDRQSLSTYRTMGSTLAGVVIGAGVPLLAYEKVGNNTVLNGSKFTLIAGVFSILAIISYFACFSLTTERVHRTSEEVKRKSIKDLIKTTLSNRSLISIVFASTVMLLAQLTMQSMSNYIYPNYYGNVQAQSASTIAMLAGMAIAAGVAKPLSRKFGKAEVSTLSSLLAAAISVLLFIIRPENVWVYVLINFVSWFGLGIFAMVSWALITDVIDDSEVKHGVREDGTIYAMYSFARKVGQAASAGLTGALLTAIGYSEENAFNPQVLRGIYDISTLVPALGFSLLCIILWFWYPLHKKKVIDNVRILRERHGSH